MGKNFAEDYVDVATRIIEFREKHPEGSLQPANPENPVKVVTVGDKTFLQYVAAAYRTPDDPRPGIGIAWEPFPGQTPFTRDSEAMVCETSAWGRALIAVGAADAKRGIASANEVRNRQQPKAKPNPTNPKLLIMERLKQDGISPEAFVAWLEDTHGVSRLDDLDGDARMALVKQVTSGALTSTLKGFA